MILLGYEVGTGKEVLVPLGHTIITGQSQKSGKTTALEAMAARATAPKKSVGPTVIAFVTKRGEGSFVGGHPMPHAMQPFFKQRTDWRFVAATLESAFAEKMRFERTWIVRACKGAKTLADVRANAADLQSKAKKSMDRDLFMMIGEYLDEVLPDIESLPRSSSTYDPALGAVNVVDVVAWRARMQMLFVASTLDHVAHEENNTIVIIPESWSMLPERRNTPVKEPAVEIARKGAAVDNYLFLDCQDIAGVSKEIIRQSSVWLLGVQREANEIKRTLEHLPSGLKAPKMSDVAGLDLGQFFACTPDGVVKTYVRPAWMPADVARRIATGQLKASDVAAERKATAASGAGRANEVAPWEGQAPWKGPGRKPDIEDVVTSMVAGLRDEIVGRLDAQGKKLAEVSESVGMLMRGDWPVFLPRPLGPKDGVKVVTGYTGGKPEVHRADDFVALGPTLDVVAKDGSRQRAKEKAIASGVDSPLVVRESKLKKNLETYEAKGWLPMEEELYQKFKKRFVSELRNEVPKILQVLATLPELDVTVERKTVTLSGDSLRGRLALLIQAKFFDESKEDKSILKELYRRGGTIGDARNYKRELGWFAENGFLTVEDDGYRAAQKMKINFKEA